MDKNDQEDSELIRRFKQGDKEAFKKLYQKYRDRTMKILLKQGVPRAETEDYCQDIFLSLIKHFQKNDLRGRFKSFLNQIIRHKIIDFYRKERYILISIYQTLCRISINGEIKIPSTEIEGTLSDKEEQNHKFELENIIEHCLKKITNVRWRTVIALWVKDFKREQIANELKITLGSVCSAISRARPEFVECVFQNYYKNE